MQKIFKSLIKIGIPTDKILLLLEEIVNEITLISFYERRQKFISTGDIRTCVYTKICNMPVDNEVSSYDNNKWAGKYARRYGHNNKRMKILMPDGREEVLSYNFVVRELLKDVIIKVTNCDEYYESVLRNELNYMAEEIIQFLKNCNLYYIKYDVLVDFVIEMAMQTPHPWLINDTTREKIIEYNRETLEKHLLKLNGRQEEITVLETLYHATAIILCPSEVQGKTILISSHILSEIALLADDIGVIHNGTLLEESSFSDLEKKNRKYLLFQVSQIAKASNILEQKFGVTNYSVEDNQYIRIYSFDVDAAEINRVFALNDIFCSSSANHKPYWYLYCK